VATELDVSEKLFILLKYYCCRCYLHPSSLYCPYY